MNALALAVAMHVAVASPPCVDLSGRYVAQGEDGRVYARISQSRCTSVSISWKSSLEPEVPPLVHTLPLTREFQADKGWFGASQMQFTAAELQGSTLSFYSRPLSQSPSTPPHLLLRLRQLPDGDLCVTSEDTSARSPAHRSSRLRGHGSTAEDNAAARSEKPCE